MTESKTAEDSPPFPGQPVRFDVYTSDNLHASAFVFDRSAPICIGFGGHGGTRSVFGVGLALRHGINWIAVSSRGSDRYQYPDLPRAEAAIREAVRGFPRIVTYGMSAGAFAALLFAKAVGAHAILACSPRVPLQPDQPGYGGRWDAIWARLATENSILHTDLAARLPCGADVLVVYDPLHDDRRDADALAAIRPIRRLLLPFAGHGTLQALRRLGLSSRLVRDMMDGSLSLPAFQALVHQRRRGGEQAFGIALARIKQGRELAPPLLERAASAREGQSVKSQLVLARHAARSGRPDTLATLLGGLAAESAFFRDLAHIGEVAGFAQALDGQPAAGALSERLLALAGPPIPEWDLLKVEREAEQLALQLSAALMLRAADNHAGALDLALSAADGVSAWDASNRALATVLEALGEADRAEALLRRLHVRQGADIAIHHALAKRAQRRGDIGEVARIWDTAASQGCNTLQIAYPHARALMKAGRVEDALAALAPLLAVDMPPVNAWRLRGDCLLRLNRPEEAVMAYGAAEVQRPDDAEVQRALSRAHLQLGQAAEALRHAEIAFRLAPEQETNRNQLARVREHMAKAAAAARRDRPARGQTGDRPA